MKRFLIIIILIVFAACLVAAAFPPGEHVYRLDARTTIYTQGGTVKTVLAAGAIIRIRWFGPTVETFPLGVRYQRNCGRPVRVGYVRAWPRMTPVYDDVCLLGD